MPRSPSGEYNPPAGVIVNSGDTILVSQHNPFVNDVSTALSNSLDRNGTGGMRAPLQMGGNPIQNVAAGSNPNDVATVAQAQAAGSPVGSSMDYWGNIAPVGWLLCFGQAISRTVYADLFAVLGTTYGAGDGVTTFNVPDCRGRAVVGKDDMGGTSANRMTTPINGDTLGAAGGVESITLDIANLPAHNHGGTTGLGGAHDHNVHAFLSSPGGFQQGAAIQNGTLGAGIATDVFGDHVHPIPSQGGNTAHSNVQPSIVANKIIRTGVV